MMEKSMAGSPMPSHLYFLIYSDTIFPTHQCRVFRESFTHSNSGIKLFLKQYMDQHQDVNSSMAGSHLDTLFICPGCH